MSFILGLEDLFSMQQGEIFVGDTLDLITVDGYLGIVVVEEL